MRGTKKPDSTRKAGAATNVPAGTLDQAMTMTRKTTPKPAAKATKEAQPPAQSAKKVARKAPAKPAVAMSSPASQAGKALSPAQAWAKDVHAAAQEVFEAMAQGSSVRAFAEARGFPPSSVMDVVQAAEAERPGYYARARDERAHALVEKALAELDAPVERGPMGALDPAFVAHRRLRIDTIKWFAAKLSPRAYGDRLELDAKVQHDVVGELRSFLAAGSRLPLGRGDASGPGAAGGGGAA